MLIVLITYNRLERTIDSVHSVVSDLKKSKKNHRLVVVDNCSRDGTAKCLAMMQARNRCFHELVLNNFNLGKAKAINGVVEKYHKEDTILCSYDGDLIIDNDYDGRSFFDIMEDAYILALRDCKFAILCANLTGDMAHNMRLLRAMAAIPQGEILYNPKGGCGVAGGCITVSIDIFVKSGCYRTNHGVYGGNDGFLIADVMANYPEYRIGMAKFLSLYHPFEKDEGYEKFKRDTVDKIRTTGFGSTKGYYDENSNGGVQQP